MGQKTRLLVDDSQRQGSQEIGGVVWAPIHRGRLRLRTPGPDLVLGFQRPPLIAHSFPPPPGAPTTFFNTPLKIKGAAEVGAAPETDKR